MKDNVIFPACVLGHRGEVEMLLCEDGNLRPIGKNINHSAFIVENKKEFEEIKAQAQERYGPAWAFSLNCYETILIEFHNNVNVPALSEAVRLVSGNYLIKLFDD